MMYAATCTCGDVMKVEATSKEDAIEKLKAMMTPEMVTDHIKKKHNGIPPSTDDMATFFSHVHPVSA